ncbi:high potential iron-sulfur protein [Lasius niger]|uniref:High potential iron-sulfur protein n=1 Tax=Lasius niger TaxID=67767 RepID=A0A0J7K166_LASNI|nr:high potential iron-sulfur protein [Lasius niger]
MSGQSIADARRRCLKTLVVTGAVLAVGWGAPRRASAQALPQVAANDPAAKALSYVPQAAASKNSAHKAGADCAACRFYRGKPDHAAGLCPLFPGKEVKAGGWCQAFTAK